MNDGNRRERLHRRVWDLLPWYANGTLPDGERRTVEAHLAECPRCRGEIVGCQRLGEAIRQTEETAPAAHPARLARLMERIDDEERSGEHGWRRAVLAPWRGLAGLLRATPPLARGALVAQLVLLVALAGLLVRRPPCRTRRRPRRRRPRRPIRRCRRAPRRRPPGDDGAAAARVRGGDDRAGGAHPAPRHPRPDRRRPVRPRGVHRGGARRARSSGESAGAPAGPAPGEPGRAGGGAVTPSPGSSPAEREWGRRPH